MALVLATGHADAIELLEALEARIVGDGRPVRRVRGRFTEREEAGAGLGALLDADPSKMTWSGLADQLEDRTVLLVEDAQWLDEPSLRVLAGLADHADEHEIGLIVCRQPVPVTDDLAPLDAALNAGGGLVR